MAHHSTLFSQLLRLLPRHEFEALAREHHSGARLRAIGRWDQWLALLVAQLTKRSSLRDLVVNFNAQSSKLFHLGSRAIRRSTLARVNEAQPASLFEALFHRLVAKTRELAPGHRFRFKAPLISLDSSIIQLSLSLFPWARYQRSKGAIKLHLGLDHAGHLPVFAAITEGNRNEMPWARGLELPAGSVVVFDRGFFDSGLFQQLADRKVRFVTRLKKGIRYKVLERRSLRPGRGLTSDQLIELKGRSTKHLTTTLRRIGYRDPETGKHLVFLTNAIDLAASTIQCVYKDRWQIELFFKWIKQNLRIKSFLGTSKNAVASQIWVALCAYLMLAYLKFQSTSGWSLKRLLGLLQLNLFERTSLQKLFRPPDPHHKTADLQLSLQVGW